MNGTGMLAAICLVLAVHGAASLSGEPEPHSLWLPHRLHRRAEISCDGGMIDLVGRIGFVYCRQGHHEVRRTR